MRLPASVFIVYCLPLIDSHSWQWVDCSSIWKPSTFCSQRSPSSYQLRGRCSRLVCACFAVFISGVQLSATATAIAVQFSSASLVTPLRWVLLLLLLVAGLRVVGGAITSILTLPSSQLVHCRRVSECLCQLIDCPLSTEQHCSFGLISLPPPPPPLPPLCSWWSHWCLLACLLPDQHTTPLLAQVSLTWGGSGAAADCSACMPASAADDDDGQLLLLLLFLPADEVLVRQLRQSGSPLVAVRQRGSYSTPATCSMAANWARAHSILCPANSCC